MIFFYWISEFFFWHVKEIPIKTLRGGGQGLGRGSSGGGMEVFSLDIWVEAWERSLVKELDNIIPWSSDET